MANIRSQIKRNKQNEKRRLRNRIYHGNARTAVKKARAAIESGEPNESQAAVLAAVQALDRAAQKGSVHKNNAARRKSRLIKRLANMTPQKGKSEPATGKAAQEKAESKPKAQKSTKNKTTSKKTTTKK